jgi:hypothetical protein
VATLRSSTNDSPFSDQQYFAWLVDQVDLPTDAQYDGLLNVMFGMEFVWIIGNDENRIADGRDLRLEYLDRLPHEEQDAGLYDIPVSFLEVLVGLSRRVAFLVDQDARVWAWRLIRNLKLGGFHDPLTGREVRKVMRCLEGVIWRRIGPDGSGGFFPLTDPKDDQRTVEIWYQMTAYINENRESFGL